MPDTKGMPSSVSLSRTKAAVAFSWRDSSGCACKCRRHAVSFWCSSGLKAGFSRIVCRRRHHIRITAACIKRQRMPRVQQRVGECWGKPTAPRAPLHLSRLRERPGEGSIVIGILTAETTPPPPPPPNRGGEGAGGGADRHGDSHGGAPPPPPLPRKREREARPRLRATPTASPARPS